MILMLAFLMVLSTVSLLTVRPMLRWVPLGHDLRTPDVVAVAPDVTFDWTGLV